jgi:hypothetical protein
MKKLLFLFLLFPCKFIFAQDTIVKVNGEKIPANIIEINNDDIKYKRASMPDGAVFIINRSIVWKIIYRSGEVDIITIPKSTNATEFGGEKHREFVSVNSVDLPFGIISFAYEMNFYKDLLAFRIPISSGIGGLSGASPASNNGNYDYYSRNKKFSTGLDFLYYPLGQNHPISYFTGASFVYGLVGKESFYNNYPGPSYYEAYTSWFSGIGLLNGVLINISERVNISTYMALGMKATGNRPNPNPYYGGGNSSTALFQFGFNMGIRFGKPSVKEDVAKK